MVYTALARMAAAAGRPAEAHAAARALAAAPPLPVRLRTFVPALQAYCAAGDVESAFQARPALGALRLAPVLACRVLALRAPPRLRMRARAAGLIRPSALMRRAPAAPACPSSPRPAACGLAREQSGRSCHAATLTLHRGGPRRWRPTLRLRHGPDRGRVCRAAARVLT